MSAYLLIESRDPYESGDCGHVSGLAIGLKHAGNNVSVLLINNGVLPARRGSINEHLNALLRGGITVLADDFSLRERGIFPGKLRQGVEPAAIGLVIDKLLRGVKVIWH